MIPKFKIRCSAIGSIMTNGKDAAGLTDKQGERLKELVALSEGLPPKPLTETQLKRLAVLTDKDNGCTKAMTTTQVKELSSLIAKRDDFIYISPKQQEELIVLIAKRDKPPELSATAKTYCKEWLKEKLYNRRKEIKSKYLDKGNACESQSLRLINAQTMEEYELNSEYKENDYLTGTCDIQGDDVIRDIKNSWSPDTFPLFDTGIKDKGYWWQLQGYCELYDKSTAWLDYTLIDAPLHLIKNEAKSIAYREGLDYDTIFTDVHNTMTFSDIPQHLKHKCFNTNRDSAAMEEVYQRVILCRQYITQLQGSL